MKKCLDTILSERQLNWRQHCGQTPNWGLRKPSVMDLSADALAVCRKNPAAYGKRIWRNGDILFPAIEISSPYPLPKADFGKNFIVSVPDGHAFYTQLAKKMGGKIVSDTSELPAGKAAVIFGSSAENKHACRLAMLQRVMANGIFPGKGGWSLEFPYGKDLRAVVCCDEASEKAFLKHWEGDRRPISVPGPGIPELYKDPVELLRTQVSERMEVEGFEDFTSKMIEAFDCGGPEVGRDNGHVNVPPMVKCYYAYFYTGDRRFLQAFKDIFFGMVRYYLTYAGGASYISDYDFYLGPLVNCFAAAERDPLFTEEDRLLGTAFLLSSFRLIEKYGKEHWPLRECALRFNHETFPAISCYWAARYFGENYGLKTDAARWKFYAKTAFSGGEISRTWRQRENSGDYQWIVPSQKLQWDLAEKGKPSPCFRQMAEAIACVSDNQGRQIGYGDAAALGGVAHKDMVQALAQLCGDKRAERLSYQLDLWGASYLPVPGWGGYLHKSFDDPGLQDEPGWKMEPLVAHVLKRFPEAAKCKVDKALYRDENRYFLFEPCSCDSHRHHDTGAILAYEHGKHLWLVDNGYGFDLRNSPVNMVLAYSSREIGPHCHNTVIFRNKEGKVVYPPEFSRFSRKGDTLYSEMVLPGAVWVRQVKLLSDGLNVTDRITRTGETEIVTVECQFNALGSNKLVKGAWHLEQKEEGTAVLRFNDSVKTKVSESSYLTKGWEAVLRKRYPYAEGDVKQLRRIAPVPAEGETLVFESTFTVGLSSVESRISK